MAKYLNEDGLLYFWQKIKNLFAQKTDLPGVVSKNADGLAPKLPNETTTTKFLRQDGTWEVPSGTTAPGTVSPKMDGTAAVGTSAKYAREDHVHPSDTTKVDKVTGKGLSTNDYTTADKNAVATIGDKVDKVEGKGLSTNDYTTAEKNAVATISDKVDKEAGKGLSTNDYTTAEKNKLAAFGEASTYALKSDITNMYKYKGSVATASALPTTGQMVGDVYNIEADSTYGGAGMNVAWDGTTWDPLGEIFSIARITNSEIDTIVAG